MSMRLECHNISFAYPNNPPILENVSLTFPAGRYFWLRGPSGCGKSTLLRLLCRLLEPTSGSISLNGRPYRDIEPPTLRRQVVYLHQTPVVLEASVEENLLLPFTFALNRDLPQPDKGTLSAWLEDSLLTGVGLESPAASLSVGQKQRLGLLRALVLEPAVLLLDEPTAALDAESARVVFDLVQRVNREQGTTIILVAHGGEVRRQAGVHILEFKEKKIVGGEDQFAVLDKSQG